MLSSFYEIKIAEVKVILRVAVGDGTGTAAAAAGTSNSGALLAIFGEAV